MDAAFAWYNQRTLEEFRAMDDYQKFKDQSNPDRVQNLKKKRGEILRTLRQGTLAILIFAVSTILFLLELETSNDPHPTHSHIPNPVQPDSLGRLKSMTEIIDDIVAQIDQIIFWLRMTVYLVMGICVVWLTGFIRRNLGLDTHSIELRRIRRLLERQNSDK